MEQYNNLPWIVVFLPLIGFLINAFMGWRLVKAPRPVVETGPILRKPPAEPVSYEMERDDDPATPHTATHSDTVASSHDDHSHGHAPFVLDKGGMNLVGWLATGIVGVAFVVSVMLFLQLLGMTGEKRIFTQPIEWMPVIGLNLQLMVDPLTALMLLIITGIGFFIHMYSIGYMGHDNGFARYFAYLNLFVFFMLVLVMGANLPVVFIGWEGVGLASYLLIGFWYDRKSANDAGKKAFIVNRVGDAALLIAMFALYKYFGTMDFYGANGILTQAGLATAEGNGYRDAILHAVPLLMFLGAAGKSAQIPLYVWLPDAMEGPTPVSALIHAATMVTGGVYLLCRSHLLVLQSEIAMTVIAVVGVTTAALAALIALTQNDIKKVLAYSTVSQLGYMFLAVGVGAFGTAMFHVTTHAFFKALLFLGSGSVIHAMGGEQDMRKMGGLSKKLPQTYLTMWIGTAAIAGVPPLAGFFSKDEIIANAFAGKEAGGLGHPLLGITAIIVAGLTAFYMGRMMFKTFSGAPRYSDETAKHIHESPMLMLIPLFVLAFLSVVGGFMGGFAPLHIPSAFEGFLGETVEWRTKEQHLHLDVTLEWILVGISVAAAIGGLFYAQMRFNSAKNGEYLNPEKKTAGSPWWFSNSKFFVDEFYEDTVVEPGSKVARWLWRVGDVRVVDGAVNGLSRGIAGIANGLRNWQSGYVRSYALSMLFGVVVVVVGCLVGLLVGAR